MLDTNIVIYVIKRRPIDVSDYNKRAANHYGNIRASLERVGQTIGVNDLHIAGHARSEGLRVENWV